MPVSRRTFCAAAVCAACAAPLPRAAFAAAGEMQLMQSMLEPRGRDLYLSMSWEFDLPETLVDSLRRGIPLYFVCEVNLQSKRWYWFDRDLADLELVQRISFSPLTRQYRFSTPPCSKTRLWNSKCACALTPPACPNRCRSSSAATPTGRLTAAG